jgi:hypothetical protein
MQIILHPAQKLNDFPSLKSAMRRDVLDKITDHNTHPAQPREGLLLSRSQWRT